MGATLSVPGPQKYRQMDEHVPVPGPWRRVGSEDIDAQAVRCSDLEQVLQCGDGFYLGGSWPFPKRQFSSQVWRESM